METDRVRLSSTPGTAWAWLRELSGDDEQRLGGTTTADALALLDRLLVAFGDAGVGPGQAAQLTAADRDRLLAAVFIRTFGPRIDNSLRCPDCGALYDIDFSLTDLLARQVPADGDERAGDGIATRLDDGSFRLADGTRLRPPTGEDECAVLGLSPAEAEQVLLDRCLMERGAEQVESPNLALRVQAALESLAPTLDVALGTVCAECGAQQPVRFDIQHYLLSALQQEQPRLMHEVHRLASAYGWSLGEILSLPRSQRRRLVALVEAERSPAWRELS